MSTERESIGDYVRRVANEKGLSFREVARRAGLSSPTISDIVSGETKEIKSSTIIALAKGLDVPEEEVFNVVRGVSGNGDEPSDLEQEIAVMFYGWKDASPEAKAETMAALRMIAESFQRRRDRKTKKK